MKISNIGDFVEVVNDTIRLNKLVIKTNSIEAMEWQELFDENEVYQVRFHTLSGKLYTRQASKEVVKELIELIQGE